MSKKIRTTKTPQMMELISGMSDDDKQPLNPMIDDTFKERVLSASISVSGGSKKPNGMEFGVNVIGEIVAEWGHEALKRFGGTMAEEKLIIMQSMALNELQPFYMPVVTDEDRQRLEAEKERRKDTVMRTLVKKALEIKRAAQ